MHFYQIEIKQKIDFKNRKNLDEKTNLTRFDIILEIVSDLCYGRLMRDMVDIVKKIG